MNQQINNLWQLKRTGLSPVRFDGTLIAESIGQYDGFGNSHNRWHDIRIYSVNDSGEYVLEVVYMTLWEKELPFRTVYVGDDAAIEDYLLKHNPTKYVTGFPPLPHYADRQKNLHAWVKSRFDKQVGEILSDAGFVETITG